MNFKASTTAAAVALSALGLAGCGSSKAPGVILAPSSGGTSGSKVAALPTTSTPTTTTPAVATPTTGPLSKEPTITVPTSAPPTQLVVKDLVKGIGTAAHKGSQITVNYVGALYKNGKVFDASWKRHQTFGPFQLGAGAVIPGWDQGLVGLKVGGRRELIVPPGLGYGKKGSPPVIPPNATLIFVVDLLSASG
jgi:peptidylprolyl isomerase